MGLGWIWPVVLVLGLVALVWGLLHARSAARRDDGRGGERRSGDGVAGGPRDILRERFARGEIAEEELRQRLKVLDDR